MRGLGVDPSKVAAASGLTEADLSRVTSYDLIPEDPAIRAIAQALSLDPEKLIRVAKGWVPDGGNDGYQDDSLSVWRVILSAGMEVNAYVLRCETTGEGALIDAGGQAEKISELIETSETRITHILLTHGHGDHVGAAGQVKRSTGARVYGSQADASMAGGRVVDEFVTEGWKGRVGELEVAAHELPGHTAGGIGFYSGKAYFSGDALFAGSLGGARGAAYTEQIETVRAKVLSLPGETRIYPGHGPITTAGQELDNNPCFLN